MESARRAASRWPWRWSSTMSDTESTTSSTMRVPSEGPRSNSGLLSVRLSGLTAWSRPTAAYCGLRAACDASASLDSEEARAVLIQQLQHLASAQRDAGEGVIGDDHGQAGLFHEQLVEVAQQGA